MLLYFLTTLVLISAALGQAKTSVDSKVEAQIIALERAGWKAWKDKNPAWYRRNTTEDVMLINSFGVANKAQMIKDISTCDVKSFALDDFKLVMLNSDTVLMTYTAVQDGRLWWTKDSDASAVNGQLRQARRQMARSDVYGNADGRTEHGDPKRETRDVRTPAGGREGVRVHPRDEDRQ